MYTDKRISQIAEVVYSKHVGEYDYIGIRVQDDAHGAHIGETVAHKSSIWIDGDETDERLNGLCAVDAQYARKHFRAEYTGYAGNIVLILGSNDALRGEDDGEIIMVNPVVLDITA